MTDIQLDYQVPGADLSPFITIFYRFASAAPRFDDVERADHAQWRFRLSPGAAGYRFPDGSEAASTPIHAIAATAAAQGTWAEGPVLVFGMGLTPGGWRALLGQDASAMLNRVIDLGALLGPGGAATLAALRAAPDLAAMVSAAEPLLRRVLLPGGCRETLRFVAQVDGWLAGAASPDVAELTRRTGLSRRQVERRCKALYGFPPKLLSRKYRALRCATAIAARAAGADALIAEGFYDQSHMIREVKRFTGWTPGQMRDRPTALARLTIAQRRALGGQVGPLISDT